MKIGIPTEVKSDEYRVSILPGGVQLLCNDGHEVVMQAGAGLGSGFPDDDYLAAGARTVPDARSVFELADMIVKVKEPQAVEYPLVRSGQILFTYFHFAASESLTEAMLSSGATCLAYETLRDDRGHLPLLTPMSEVAGRMSIQEGAKFLEKPQGGAGILLGGVPGVAPAHVTVLGGGVVGTNAARMAAGLGAHVTILDVNLDRLRYLAETMPANVTTLYSDRNTVISELTKADLVVGAVLVPGAKAPKLVLREDLQRMKPGSVLVDVAVDQGGCIETTKATTHQQPTYIIDGVVHYCVANMPGAVGRTSTFALCNATLPWIHLVAGSGSDPVADCVQIESAINIHQGRIMHHALAKTFPELSATA